MSTCGIYKNETLLGTGSITNASTSVTGFTATSGVPTPIGGSVALNRNVQVAITSSTNVGATFYTRCTADNGSGTLTLKDANPFST